MAGVAGRLFGIKMNGAFVSCEISCEIVFDREMLPATAVDSGGWKEYINGLRGWSINVNGKLLLDAVGADIKTLLQTAYFSDLPLYVQFATRPSVTEQLVFSGNALLPSANISAGASGTANWTATLQGNGKLNHNLQDFLLLIDAMPAEADYPTIVNEDVV